MKKIFKATAVLLAAVFVLGVFGCGSNTETDEPIPPNTENTATDSATTGASTTEEITTGAATTEEITTEEATTEEIITEEATTEEITTEEATTEEMTTEEATTEATTEEATTEEITTEEATTEAATEAATTEKVTTAPLEKTDTPTNVKMCTINDGYANKLMIYCEVEEYATVYICDKKGNILFKGNAHGPCFYAPYDLPDGEWQNVYLYAKAEGKELSGYKMVTLRHTAEVGHSTFVGKDSRLYFTPIDYMYYGNSGANVTDEALNNVKGYLTNKLNVVRAQTGKNTKIIILVCTNPVTIYHDKQFSESEGGRGDYYTESPSTILKEYMKDNEDIYILDLREILTEHKDEDLFMQCDTHWTTLAAYYGYTELVAAVKRDFPSTTVYPLSKYTVAYGYSGGDLLNFTGGSSLGMRSWKINVACDFSYTLPSDAPTAYVMGDSYYGAISKFLPQVFSQIYLNTPAENAPLYDYSLNDLETRRPDYLLYIWTERNVESDYGIIFN